MTMEPHPNTSTASTVVVKYALIGLLVLGLISQCSAICRKQALIHLITHEGCETRRVPSFGCRGTCTSYSRVSPTDYTQMERSCQCCQETNHRIRQVRLACPNLYPPTLFVELRQAMSCTCRPCNNVSGVPTITRLEDIK